MEQQNIKTGQLKRRILKSTLFVCSFAMVISTMISYIFVQRIVRKQVLEDIQAKFRQLGRQIDVLAEDIENFAKVIVADEEIQKNMITEDGSTTFDNVKRKEEIARRLRFYNGLRTYVSGSFAESANGEHYSSSTSTGDDQVEAKFRTAEVKRYVQEQRRIFSEPYYGVENWDDSYQSVCYRRDIWSHHQYGEKLGSLYLEIYLRSFENIIEQTVTDPHDICLMEKDGTILYQKGGQAAEDLIRQEDRGWEPGIHRVKNGYLVCQDIPTADWMICVVIDNGYLWSRSVFVLTFFVLSFCFTIAAVLFTISHMLEAITKPITKLSRAMGQTQIDKLEAQPMIRTQDEIEILYECYNNMVQEIQRGIEERMAYEKKTRDMEFDILLSQINPHYLYNVLHTVVYLAAAGKSKEVVQVTNSLLYTLQDTLKLGEKNIETTVEKELELTEHYLNIQKYRYPERFQVDMICDDQDRGCIVPKTLIQPLVENAILHGILPAERKGVIRVEVRHREEALSILIEDDGQGIRDEILAAFEQGEAIVLRKNGRRHIGISNIRDRIVYLYGAPYGMRMENRKEGGTRARVEVPYKN